MESRFSLLLRLRSSELTSLLPGPALARLERMITRRRSPLMQFAGCGKSRLESGEQVLKFVWSDCQVRQQMKSGGNKRYKGASCEQRIAIDKNDADEKTLS